MLNTMTTEGSPQVEFAKNVLREFVVLNKHAASLTLQDAS
jgi:hypothetical protein